MAAAAQQSAQHHASQFTSRQRTVALVVVALAFVMDLLDSTIVNIAIPSIQANLHATYSQIQWLIAGYLLSFATLLITGGRMGDVYGYKKIFMIGVGGFTFASLLSGLAWSPEVLIAARVLQGAMAALMVPQVMSLMQVMYDKDERGKVMGLFGALGGLAATLGPIVGGLLIQWNIAGLDWRPIFLINIPVGIFALIAAWRVLPPGKSAHPLKLDITGTFALVIALLALIFPLVEGRDLDWPVWCFVMMAASIPLLALFWWYEKRKMAFDGSPLVVPELFKLKSFTAGLTVNFSFEMMFIGFFLINTLVLQAGLGFSVIHAALTGIPFAIGIGLAIGAIGPKLLVKLGRNVIFIGIALMGLGYASIAAVVLHFVLDTTTWQLLIPNLLAGLGAGLIMAPIFSVVLTDVDVAHAGSASGILNAVQQVGGAVGVAVIGVVFFGLISHGAVQSAQKAESQLRAGLAAAGLPPQAETAVVNQFKTCFYDRSTQKDSSVVPASCQPNNDAAQQISPQTAASITSAIQAAAKTANADNFARAFGWSIVLELVLLGVVCAFSFLLPKTIKPESEMAV